MIVRRHLIEVGFMGAGKTTVGKAVAERTGRTFYDTDAFVERQASRSIPQIFADPDGENTFRIYEQAALQAILDQEPGIISTGGGIVSTQLGREMLRSCRATEYGLMLVLILLEPALQPIQLSCVHFSVIQKQHENFL